MMQQSTNMFTTRKITIMAMFAAISAVLMYIEFPLPFIPPFLKIDLSGVAVLIAAFMLGPVPAMIVAFLKNLAHYPVSTTIGVGELADFIMLSVFAVTAALVYRRQKDKNHALIGCLVATAVLCVFGVFANMFLLIPFYSKVFMPLEAIVSTCQAVNPAITNINGYYIFAVIPFNFIKGIILSGVTVLVYKKLSVIIRKFDQK